MKLKKSIILPSGKTMPVGTELHFSVEGLGFYEGEEVNIYGIPTHAIEGVDELVANQFDPEVRNTNFADVKPGDTGVDRNGSPIVILGKATGEKGFAELLSTFGNAGNITWEILTNETDVEQLDTLELVAYTDKDEMVCIDKYSMDAVAVEAEGPAIIDFENISVSQKAINRAGDEVVIYAIGMGKTQYDNWCDAFGVECKWDAIRAEVDESVSDDELPFVYAGNSEGLKEIDVYGETGIKAYGEAGTEAAGPRKKPTIGEVLKRYKEKGAIKDWKESGDTIEVNLNGMYDMSVELSNTDMDDTDCYFDDTYGDDDARYMTSVGLARWFAASMK
jgi:hypothetical protein